MSAKVWWFRGALAAATVGVAGFVYPAATTVDVLWQSDANGDPSGDWNDPTHWSDGAVPGANKHAKFNLATNYEIRISQDVSTLASLWLMPNYGRLIRFSGEGATFAQDASVTPTYADMPFAVRIKHPSVDAFYTFFNVCQMPVFTNAVSRFTDFDLTAGYTNGEWRLDFNRGDFNFSNPDGKSPGWNTSVKHMLFEYSQPGNKQGIYMHKGSSVSLCTLYFQGSAAESTICADGGEHFIEGYVYAPLQTTYLNTSRTVSSLISTGAGTSITINGSTFVSQNSLTPPYNASNRVYRFVAKDCGRLNINGSVDHYRSDFYIGAENGATVTVSKAVSLAKYAGATGTIYAVDSTLNFTSTQNGNDALRLGEVGQIDGLGRVRLEGSEMYCNPNIDIRRGEIYATNSVLSTTHLFRIGSDSGFESSVVFDDSTVRVAENSLNVGYGTDGRGKLVLKNGATLTAYGISSPSGQGVFEADGAVLKAQKANSGFFGGLASAKIGAGGLVLHSDFDITISQSFSDADGGDAAGSIELAGSGLKRMTGDLTGLGCLRVSGGTADLAGLELRNLVVDGGILLVDSARPLTVTGTFEPRFVRIAFASGADFSEEKTLFLLARPLSGAELLAWKEAVVTSGLAEGKVCEFSQKSSGEGYALTAKVRDAVTISYEVSEGIRNVSEDIVYDALDTLRAEVESSASLNLSGTVRRGELLKYGNGALRLSGNSNQFVYGVGLHGGLLSFSSSLSLGLVGDAVVSAGTLADGVIELLGAEDAVQEKPFTVNAKDNATAVVFKNETGWRMPVPVVSKGSIIKRGGGRMVWTVAGENTFNSSGDGNGSNEGGFWPHLSTSISPLVFDDVNGGQPIAGVFMPLTVAEGELVIKGSGNGAKLRMPGSVAVAAPTAQGSVQPGLVLDNVELNYYTYACHFSLGPGLNYGSSVDFAKTPYLVLTNNATLNGLVMQVSRFGEGAVTNRVIVDNSKMLITSSLYPNRSQDGNPVCLYEFRNNAKLFANNLIFFRDFTMYFDASTLAKNAVLEPTGFANEINNKICTGAFEFRNGSLLCCSSIASQAAGRTKPVRLLFDNSEWRPVIGGDFVFNWTDMSYVKVNVEGAGLVLDVPGSAIWTMNMPVNGSGGLVKKGDGTLLLGEDAVSYSGVTRIDEGLLDLGGKMHALKVSGSGTVAGGTIASGGMCVKLGDDGVPEGPLPKFRDVAFAGRFKVDLGRDVAENRIEIPGKTVKIAEYEGGSIDVSRWRVVNAGRKNVSGNFEAKDGSVYMTLDNAGLSLIVR
ncbi:MAG: hypothetical protein IKZ22_08055 [Kiritimatiellae bacterium]|nr:hypothetical protein [Kiritimatiellia bacterium]